MSRKTWHRIHKWVAIVVGVSFLAWTISGIVMMLPGRWFQPPGLRVSPQADYRAAQVSPGQAIINLGELAERPVEVISLSLKQVGETAVYEINLTDGSSYLVDAESGEIVRITPEFAERVVRDRLGIQTVLLEVETLDSHELLYPFGPLPVYRLVFEGEGSNVYYVSPRDGNLWRSNNLTRIREAIMSLHTFAPISLFVRQDRVRKVVMLLFSLAGIAAALTGYYLALLPYLRNKTKAKTLSTGGSILEKPRR